MQYINADKLRQKIHQLDQDIGDVESEAHGLTETEREKVKRTLKTIYQTLIVLESCLEDSTEGVVTS